ncbi:MAG: glycosyltransferase family protein [Candidatus Micrarchaeota archaeon]|nr:glycosyltransferase family protein [Candidatus Micrarchaeota archaeon]
MGKTRFVAIVQARVEDSGPLPRRIVKRLNGITLIELLLERLKMAEGLDQIVLATTKRKEDDELVAIAKKQGVQFFRGSEEDLLDRTYRAAKAAKANVVVRITPDGPLIDPQLISDMIADFKRKKCDYLCNRKPPTFPDGFDVEIFTFAALEEAHKNVHYWFERKHVTPYILEQAGKFKIRNFASKKDYSQLRLTVDYPEDFEVIKAVYSALGAKKGFGLKEIAAYLKRNPKIASLNSHYIRDEGYHREIAEVFGEP